MAIAAIIAISSYFQFKFIALKILLDMGAEVNI